MSGRRAPLRDPVTITFDGDALPAERGEPVAAALIASGRWAVARSPKYHRPRGPSCMRGACDGCLARVDGVPNVMTCMTAATGGMNVQSQNKLGAGPVDLLQATDWFFPQGMNHHELMAGVPGLHQAMQAFAERVTGLGRLPAEVREPSSAARRALDVLVIGGGAAGMSVALECARAGRSVEVVDDALEYGGSLRALSGDEERPWRALLDEFAEAVATSRIRMRSMTTAAAIYGDEVLLVAPGATELVTARSTVLACGAHDVMPPFGNNDVPGVVTARAAGLLSRHGVSLGKVPVVVVDSPSSFARSYMVSAERLGNSSATIVYGKVLHAHGSLRVKAVTMQQGDDERTIRTDALVMDAARSPAYELCQQAGAEITLAGDAFRVHTRGGHIRAGFWATGEVAGVAFAPSEIREHAAHVGVLIEGAAAGGQGAFKA